MMLLKNTAVQELLWIVRIMKNETAEKTSLCVSGVNHGSNSPSINVIYLGRCRRRGRDWKEFHRLFPLDF
jgi:hypothetical protein